MKKRNTMLGMGLLIAVLVLGIGYAFNAIDLTIGGTVSVSPNSDNFKVILTNPSTGNTSDTATVTDSDTDSITGEIVINSLESVGETAIATFTVKNASDAGIAAIVTKPTITETDEGNYFSVTTSWDEDTSSTTLPSTDGSNTRELIVTVKLIKAPVDNDVTGTFEVKLTATADAE